MEQAERPAGDASSPAEGLQQEALGGLAVVLLRERAFRVHEALSRLARGGETWEGTQHALGAEAGYDERTARSALRDLESLGLVRSSRRGNRLIYQLLALTPEGVPFVVRRQSESRRGESGREVVRSARPSSLASEQIRGLVASLRAAPVASVAVAEGGAATRTSRGGSRRITADQPIRIDPDRYPLFSRTPLCRHRRRRRSASLIRLRLPHGSTCRWGPPSPPASRGSRRRTSRCLRGGSRWWRR
ncbi:MAG: hypothetical protein CVU47_12440 [Chloroflexi bacterium HGW-Chloroflexi-9]|nr:MAG: hypothetical protein CVU47_12440 [Chloroflexi bacterium HGW-Chloroflexi-9]